MFRGWTLSAIKKLIDTLEMYNYIRNQVVMSEGDKADKFFIVFDGEVELNK